MNKIHNPQPTTYAPVIGLEVHVELKTKSKMFCGCSADYFGKEPNTHVCPVCLGLPGALPIPNKKAIEWCVMIGLALNCKIPLFSKFDRKNYFYPDLPKGYQISQYDQPFAINGTIVIARSEATKQSPSKEIAARTMFARNDDKKTIRIRRVHMEEDTAKLMHQSKVQSSILRQSSGQEFKVQSYEGYSLIDFNRSGVPLVEIVTEPDFESATEVVEYLKKLQQIVRYLDVSDADMEKGEMRLEPNISLSQCHPELVSGSSSSGLEMPKQVRHDNVKLPPYKVEVKNINSFRFVEKAINYEIERQKIILEAGKVPTQETRGWDDEKQITVTQRVKEEAMDYRYFPEPDIPPIRWKESKIRQLTDQIPELPDKKSLRFQKEYGLPAYNSEILTRERSIADYFEESIKIGKKHNVNPKQIANIIINKKVDLNTILPAQLIKLIVKSSRTTAIDTQKLEEIVKDVLRKNQKAVSDYKNGKVQVLGFLIGMVKKHLPKGDTNQIKTVLEKHLQN